MSSVILRICLKSHLFSADEGCLQYHTGVSGQIKSFNYDPTSGRQLSNQDYGICVRMERNFCGIQYTACPDTGTVCPRKFKYNLKRVLTITIKSTRFSATSNL